MFRATAGLALGATLGLLSIFPAQARTMAPFMESLPFRYEGQVGGLDAWSLEGGEDLWLVLPDGNTVIVGFVFSGRGQDIGSAILGVEPVNVWESLGIEMNAADGNAPVAPAARPAPMADLAAPGVAGAPGAAGTWTETPPAAQIPQPRRLQDVMADATPDMVRLTSDQRDELLAQLVEAIAAAQTPDAFLQALVDWRHRVAVLAGEARQPPAVSTPGDQGSLIDVLPPPGSRDRSLANSGGRALHDPVQGAAQSDRTDRAGMSAEEVPGGGASPGAAQASLNLLQDISENSFWISVHRPGGPGDLLEPLHMIYDPSCPHSARAMRALEEPVRNGEVRLRVSLVPVTGRNAVELTAEILSSDNPSEVIFDRARNFGTYRQDMGLDALDTELLVGLQANLDLVTRHELPGVPFFAWQTTEGPRFLAGVPRPGHAFDLASSR